MKCPICGHLEDKVIETRQHQDGQEIRRRRECLSCENRFTSYERLGIGQIQVIKKNGKRELFSSQKLINGILKALGKGKDIQNKAENIASEIQVYAASQIHRSGELKTSTIENYVQERLLLVDKAGFVRFASVGSQLNNIDDLRKLLDQTIEGADNTV